MAALANLLPPKCLVVRDGKERHMPAEELVAGDVVKLHAGDRVPADIRIIGAPLSWIRCKLVKQVVICYLLSVTCLSVSCYWVDFRRQNGCSVAPLRPMHVDFHSLYPAAGIANRLVQQVSS